MSTGLLFRRKHYLSLSSILLALLAILFVNPLGNFPLNDDWQYAFPVKTWLKGEMYFKGVFAPNILFQVVWGYLFCTLLGGFDFTWLRFSTLTMALAGLFTFATLCRRSGVDKRVSVFGALALGLSPLYFSLSFSFMSDIPFLTCCLLSLFSFFIWLQHQKRLWLFLACLAAVAAYYIRQPGIIFLPLYALIILSQNRTDPRRWWIAFSLLLLAALAYMSLEKWLKPALGITENYVPVGDKFYDALIGRPGHTLSEWAKKGMKAVVYLGFFGGCFLPFLWEKMKRMRLLNPTILVPILLVNAALTGLFFQMEKIFPFGGNILYNFGLGPALLGDVYELSLPNIPRLPDWVMLIVHFISQAVATFLILLILKSWRQLPALNRRFVFLLFLLNAMYLPLLSITSFFDRYLLLPIASFFFILLQIVEIDKIRAFGLRYWVLVLMSLFSLFATRDYMNWNRAKNQAFNYLISQQISIREMDAGYEYNGFYNYHKDYQLRPGHSFWWVEDNSWMIAFGGIPGYRVVKTFPYYRWLFGREDAIYVLKKSE